MFNAKLITTLCEFFERESIDYAVIGALALSSYGYSRATNDVDFVINGSCADRAIDYLESLGFETLNRTNAFSNHLHPIGDVRTDLMFVDKQTASELFQDAAERNIAPNTRARVVAPMHLVMMKLFAAQSSPDRRLKDLTDVRQLVALQQLDHERIRGLMRKYGLESHIKEVVG